MRKHHVLSPGNLPAAFFGFLFWMSFSVVLVLCLRQIYYADIRFLDIAEDTGLSEQEIRDNYDVLIDYNLIWKGVDELEFPSFPMSEHGRIHFEEVKRIFVAVQCICAVSGISFLILAWRRIRKREYGFLKLLSVFTLVIPAIFGALAVADWDTFFVRFHELFFSNDYWIFDPVTDPVINILPDQFFAHCAGAILLCLVAGCIVAGGLYRIAARYARRQDRAERTVPPYTQTGF